MLKSLHFLIWKTEHIHINLICMHLDRCLHLCNKFILYLKHKFKIVKTEIFRDKNRTWITLPEKLVLEVNTALKYAKISMGLINDNSIIMNDMCEKLLNVILSKSLKSRYFRKKLKCFWYLSWHYSQKMWFYNGLCFLSYGTIK